MAHVVLGPLLRYVAEHEATVWVETDVACEVEILGRTQQTFRVGTHHYALVCIEGLDAGSEQEYDVKLDGERAWPLPTDPFPPPRIRTLDRDDLIRLSFGSCRVATHHHHPYSLKKDDSSLGREIDALYALGDADAGRAAQRLARTCSRCSATRSTRTRPRPARMSSSARGATPTKPPGSRSPTSRSTAGSTTTPGRTRGSAGCSRRSRPR